MKKRFSVLIITILMVVLSFTDSKAAEPLAAVIQFFEASKNGDVETIKRLIAGPFYDRRRALLETNKGYPEFLKKFYYGATIKPLQSKIGNADMVKKDHPDLYNKHYSASKMSLNSNLQNEHSGIEVVIVKLQFPDGSRFNFKFLLKKTNNNVWKIYDEILITKLPISSDEDFRLN